MKNERIFLLITIALSLLFLFSLQDININNEKEKNFDIKPDPLLSATGSLKTEWYRTWGGVEIENWGGILIDSLDNIYQLGLTTSFGKGLNDLSLLKYNNVGELQWNRTWGGIKDEISTSLIVDQSNNLLFAGHTESFGLGIFDAFLVKYNGTGHLQWNQTWGGFGIENCWTLASDSSSNVYIAGETNSFGAGMDDIYIVKYNASGHLLWNQTWGGSGDEECGEIVLDSSDNLYILARKLNFGKGFDICLIKYNSSGYQQWNQTWGGFNDEMYGKIVLDSTDNIYITGSNYSSGETDLHLIKYDPTGKELWNCTCRISGDARFHHIILDSLNNIYVGGTIAKSVPVVFDVFLVKYSNSGQTQWNQTLGYSDDDILRDIALDSLDNIYLMGQKTISDKCVTFLLIYDSLGSLISDTSWGGFGDAAGFSIDLDSSDQIFIGGMINVLPGDADLFLAKFIEKSSKPEIHGYYIIFIIIIFSTVSIITIITHYIKHDSKK